tara:strand:- start:375 stop:617 length:243 start_codon:yes stop_codon:yes gene_type:complete
MSFNLADLNLSTFTTYSEKFSFAVVNLRPEILEEGRGFHVMDNNGDGNLTVDEIEWVGAPPEVPLTNDEIQTKIAELFSE